MAYVASDIARIPTYGFAWYVLYLEDAFDDPLKEVLSNNFLALGKQVGPDVLVVRGFDPEAFSSSAFELLTRHDEAWTSRITVPALLVSDTAPAHLNTQDKMDAAKLILFPLTAFRDRPGALVDLLRQLVAALRDNDAMSALEQLEPGKLQGKWAWLSRYVNLKPSFMGFGLNLNAVIDDLISKSQDG